MFKMTGLFSLLTFIALQCVANNVAAQSFDVMTPEKAYGESVRYLIYRNGKSVGEHKLQFSRDENKLLVSVESNIVVTVLKIPVFRFSYRCDEQWQQGQLLSVKSVIKENKKTKNASLSTTGDVQTLIDIDGKSHTAALSLTSNHWHPGVLQSDSLFNTLTGRANQYQLEKIGEETLTTGGVNVPATRYRYTGQLNSEVWYDSLGRWVKLQFSADDGSVIEYQLAQPFANQ